jgi:DnaJ family protein C protein 2
MNKEESIESTLEFNHYIDCDNTIKKKVEMLSFEEVYEDVPSKEIENLDPTQWKTQDHYAVIGLRKLGFRATADHIKKAYRKKILKYHPDKSSGGPVLENGDNYFKCVQKAYEVLSDPDTRKLFDSVDPEFDDDIPTGKIEEDEFFEVFGECFDRNSHFSKVTPVPTLGDLNSSRESVEEFYDFWTNFSSWRSFELRDKEVPSENDNRDERRWIERQNKSERQKNKSAESSRIAKLVDNSMKWDPRLVKFRKQDAILKNSKRLAREEAAKKEAEDRRNQIENQKKQKEIEELEEKERRDSAKKEKDLKKRQIRLKKKEVRSFFDGFQHDCVQRLEAFIEKVGTDIEKLELLRTTFSDCQGVEEIMKSFESLELTI